MINKIVKLKADNNYCPVPYAVIAATIGNADTASYVWLEAKGYGIELESELTAIKEAYANNEAVDYSPLLGTPGVFTVVALSAIEKYTSPEKLVIGEKNIGTYYS